MRRSTKAESEVADANHSSKPNYRFVEFALVEAKGVGYKVEVDPEIAEQRFNRIATHPVIRADGNASHDRRLAGQDTVSPGDSVFLVISFIDAAMRLGLLKPASEAQASITIVGWIWYLSTMSKSTSTPQPGPVGSSA